MALISHIDPIDRRIYLSIETMNAAVHPVDIYREVRALRRTDESLRPFDNFMKADGNIDKGGGKATERYFTLLQGTRIVPYDESHVLDITGTLITDDGLEGAFAFDKTLLSPTTSVDLQYAPKQVEVINLNFDDLVFSSFLGGVWIDTTSPYGDKGTDNFPNGNRERPVNNAALAVEIAQERGFDTLNIIGSLVIGAGDDISNLTIKGSNPMTASLVVQPEAETAGTYIKEMYFTGSLDGGTILRDCVIGDIDYFDGYIEHCAFTSATVSINGIGVFLDCWAGATCVSDPIIDLTNAQGLAVRNYQGSLTLTNKTGPGECEVSINGRLTLTDTIVNGSFEVYGDGYVVNNGSAPVEDRTTGTPEEIVQTLLETNIHTYNTPSTVGDVLHRITYLQQSVYVDTELTVNGDGSQNTPYNNFTDAKDECELRGIRYIILSGEATLTSNLKNYTIIGVGTPLVHLNGQDCKNTTFIQCNLDGTYSNEIVVRDSILSNGMYLDGYFNNCSTLGTLFVSPNKSALLSRCMCGNVDGTPTIISMDSGAPSNLNVQGFGGGLTISNSDHIDDSIIVDMAQGILEFDSSNTLGDMIACGNCIFEDNSNGATVLDKTAFKPLATKGDVYGAKFM